MGDDSVGVAVFGIKGVLLGGTKIVGVGDRKRVGGVVGVKNGVIPVGIIGVMLKSNGVALGIVVGGKSVTIKAGFVNARCVGLIGVHDGMSVCVGGANKPVLFDW